ncbi:MAG: undecaprenyl-diphosphate phosphatase [Desulfosalsimonadaceae bacterium]
MGIIQGLTEFFPVSSSGHLVIFQRLLGLQEPALLFDICVHVGTLMAVTAYFYADIMRIFRALCRRAASTAGRGSRPAAAGKDPDLQMAVFIAAGSIPTAVLGLGFHQVADRLFASASLVGLALLFTAGLLLATRLSSGRGFDIAGFTILGAFLVGAVQGLAVVPGISRSGATIAACLMLGLSRDTAARFSFLLSIPAVLGALLLSLASGPDGWGGFSLGTLFLGTVSSAAAGYLALAGLVKIVRGGRLSYFAPYCAALGATVLLLGL